MTTLTQGPYRGREIASLSDAELHDALTFCPSNHPAFRDAGSALLKEQRERWRAKDARKAQQAAKKAAATREKRTAAWRASMTDEERRAYDAADTSLARQVVKLRVEKRLRAEAREREAEARKREMEEHREMWRREEEEEKAKRDAWFAANPDRDLWDYMKARSQRRVQSRTTSPRPDSELAAQIIAAGYKTLAKRMHPDAGGSLEKMQELNAVVERLRRVQ